MSLNYRLTGIKNWEAVTKITATADDPMRGIKAGDKIINPVTEALIFYTMFCDITPDNPEDAAEFWCRIKIHSALFGAIAYRANGSDLIPTPEEVAAHIGLSTNVSKKTRAAWLRHWNAETFRRFQEEYRKAIIARNMREIEAELPAVSADEMFKIDGPEPAENLD